MTEQPLLPTLSQPAFFSGQRLTPADLTAGQNYHREMRWLHNRSLHAWGIALGLGVSSTAGAKEVRVEPGLALDYRGRELVLTEPQMLSVPPVADPARYYLTLSYQDDAAARLLAKRKGVCAGEGAMVGRDVVLALVQVRDCKLTDAPSLADRREARPSNQPYVAAGTTGTTVWSLWRDEAAAQKPILGIQTGVDTSTGRFVATPTYLVQVLGERIYSGGGLIFFEGWVQVHQPTSIGFTCRLFMPEQTVGTWRLNPHDELAKPGVLASLVDDMRWHVTWTGVEG